jgi:hypothetical protein
MSIRSGKNDSAFKDKCCIRGIQLNIMKQYPRFIVNIVFKI